MSLQKELGLPNPLEAPGHEAVLNIVLTGELLAKEGDRLLRPFGLTDSQFNVLMLLKYQVKGGGINQTRLGQMLLVNRSNVTGLVDTAGTVRERYAYDAYGAPRVLEAEWLCMDRHYRLE